MATTLSHDIAQPFIRKDSSVGPMTAARQRRTFVIYAAMCTLGILPLLFGGSAGLKAAGLGLWFPGAGFLAAGGWATLMLPLTLILFAASMIAWFGAGMVIAPIAVWMGAAFLAGSMAGESISPLAPYTVVALTAAGLGYARLRTQRRDAKELARLAERSRYLPGAIAEVIERATPAPADRELTPEQLSAVRYALDRSLQPVGQLNGFDRVDQFQTSALRYQLCGLGYTLSLLQCHYAPSFHGYLSEAQRKLIAQYLHKQVWGYWIYESAWGHLNFTNPDPAAKGNIMLTGWFGLQVSMYMSNTGDRRYTEPGSLSFRRSRNRVFHHDLHSVERSVLQNFQDSQFCLYPCEPNWIYPICNHYGITSLVIYDRLFGTNYAAFNLNRWLEKLDVEFTDNSGSLIGLRSGLTGFRFPFPGGELGFPDFENCFAPERALRMWAIARHDLEYVLKKDTDGETRVAMNGKGFDFGNYRQNWGGLYAVMMTSAREFGDEEIAGAAQRSLDRDCGRNDQGGVIRYLGTSNLANINAVRGRITRRDDFRNAITQGPPAAIFKGPILAEASYPEVLVAKARSNGEDLDLVLYPGATPGPQRIGIERLRPGAKYVMRNGSEHSFSADDSGAASLVVELRERTPLHIIPAG